VQLNQEPDYQPDSSLNERALQMVQTEDYLYKVKLIKSGNKDVK